MNKENVQSVTRRLFVVTQLFALGCLVVVCLAVVYSAVVLDKPLENLLETITEEAFNCLATITGAKVLENIFEHNDGGVFGKSNQTNDTRRDI